MTGEMFDEFREKASELQHKVRKYQNMFRDLNNLFPKELECGSVSGKIKLSKKHPEVGHLEIAVKIDKLAAESDLIIGLGIEIGNKNIAELEKIDFPHPSHIKSTHLDEIISNDLLEEIVGRISMSDSFAPVN